MIKVVIVGADEWKARYSENAHKAVFKKIKPADWDRIDYAILLISASTDTPVGYITCRELNHESVHWQFGGSMPDHRGSMLSVEAFKAALDFARKAYKRVSFLVENTNYAMLKLAMHCKFQIIGVRNYHGSVLLEHGLEFTEGA